MSDKKLAGSAITLDTVLDSFQHWRDNKSSYPSNSIPDEIWLQVFALESQGRYKGSALRKIFGLNSTQYSRKRTELCSSSESEQSGNKQSISKESADVAAKGGSANGFGEAVVEPLVSAAIPSLNGTTKTDLSKLKSTKDDGFSFLAQSTIIVECIRSDGHRLKIHTTNNSLAAVMQSFFGQEAPQV
jgi:hypothetical protein